MIRSFILFTSFLFRFFTSCSVSYARAVPRVGAPCYTEFAFGFGSFFRDAVRKSAPID